VTLITKSGQGITYELLFMSKFKVHFQDVEESSPIENHKTDKEFQNLSPTY